MSDFELFQQLYVEVFARLQAIAYQDFLHTGRPVNSHTAIAQRALAAAKAGIE